LRHTRSIDPSHRFRPRPKNSLRCRSGTTDHCDDIHCLREFNPDGRFVDIPSVSRLGQTKRTRELFSCFCSNGSPLNTYNSVLNALRFLVIRGFPKHNKARGIVRMILPQSWALFTHKRASRNPHQWRYRSGTYPGTAEGNG
jgi:hypothetical protein